MGCVTGLPSSASQTLAAMIFTATPLLPPSAAKAHGASASLFFSAAARESSNPILRKAFAKLLSLMMKSSGMGSSKSIPHTRIVAVAAAEKLMLHSSTMRRINSMV